jgi:hypothetical protein
MRKINTNNLDNLFGLVLTTYLVSVEIKSSWFQINVFVVATPMIELLLILTVFISITFLVPLCFNCAKHLWKQFGKSSADTVFEKLVESLSIWNWRCMSFWIDSQSISVFILDHCGAPPVFASWNMSECRFKRRLIVFVLYIGLAHCWRKIIILKFIKFSGERRDARKNHGIWPYFGRILSNIDFKTQNKTLAKFQILALKSKFYSGFWNQNSRSEIRTLIPLESDLET